MGRKFEVTLDDTGEAFACAEDQNVLRGMEILGRKGIPVGCRGGGCGVCKIHVQHGCFTTRRMSRACVSEDEEAAGIVLACKVYPRSDLKIRVVGQMRKCISPAPAADGQPPGGVC
ncbi:MAG: 2Fe-2S iron-sulfur cluster binding domain-containing protein [Rhodocyclaceae bacterium]|nr:2Fe-2S iron-sulfur cluster binding domain-containing protein [Rhodocyclaceae bacterium]